MNEVLAVMGNVGIKVQFSTASPNPKLSFNGLHIDRQRRIVVVEIMKLKLLIQSLKYCCCPIVLFYRYL